MWTQVYQTTHRRKKKNFRCKHTHHEEYYGIIFCVNCGLEKSCNPYNVCDHNFFEDNDTICKNCGLINGYESINELCINYNHHVKLESKKTNLNENSKVNDLRKAAKANGIKCVTMMSKKQLCEALLIKITNEGKYVLKNIKTNEEFKFKNITEISTKFNISTGHISNKIGKNITIDGNTYSLEKL